MKTTEAAQDPEYGQTRETWSEYGNGEKNPGRGVKENLKPCAYKHIEHVKV